MEDDSKMKIDTESTDLKEETKSEKKIELRELTDKEWMDKMEAEYKRPCSDKKCPGMNHPNDKFCATCLKVELEAGKCYNLLEEEKKERKDLLGEMLVDLVEEDKKIDEKKGTLFEPIPVPAYFSEGDFKEKPVTPLQQHIEVASWLKQTYVKKAESPFFESCPGMGDLAKINTWIGNCLPLTENQKRKMLVDIIVEEYMKDSELTKEETEEIVGDELKKQEWDWDADRSEETTLFKQKVTEKLKLAGENKKRESVKALLMKDPEYRRAKQLEKLKERRKARRGKKTKKPIISISKQDDVSSV